MQPTPFGMKAKNLRYTWFQLHSLTQKPGCLIAAGANVHVGQFFKEMELTQVDPKRVGIDQNASIIEQKHSDQDKASAVNKGIGTTGWGVGPAT